MATEPEGSLPLLPYPIMGHDPDKVPHILNPKIVILSFHVIFQLYIFFFFLQNSLPLSLLCPAHHNISFSTLILADELHKLFIM
jgi:hypothetical protein